MKGTNGQSTICTPSNLQPIGRVFAELGQAKQSVLPAPVEPAQSIAVVPRADPATMPEERPASRHSSLSRDRDAESADWFSRSLIVGCLLLAGICVLRAAPGSLLRSRRVSAEVTQHTLHKPILERKILIRDISDFDVGMRASGKNPLREQVSPNLPEPKPENCRKLVLRMTKESGRLLLVNLLRELEWIAANDVIEGGTFFLDLPEMGAVGDAYVEAILPSPTFEKGPGNLVTGTFAHEADPNTKILRVEFANGAVIKGVTDNHPFYSVERHGYVPIGKMHEGDFVKVNDGVTKITRIGSRFARAGEFLYNLETHNEHVYQVTTSGILVHNSCVIHGNPQVTSVAHAQAMQDMATRLSKMGTYTDVFMHSKWSTILKGKGHSISPNRLPDIAALRETGQIDIIEFASKTDNLKTLLDRNKAIWNQLPQHMRGDIIIIDQLGNWTHAFP